jgi:hypothetical protein
MLLIKRVLLFGAEAGILAVGFVSAFVLPKLMESILENSGGFAFFGGLAFTIFAFLFVQWKTRKWKMKYDAERWLASRVERRFHPKRAKYSRLIRRRLLWLPSVCAALVVFFFPVTTHLLHMRSRYLKHYRVPIPWTWTVFSPVGDTGEYSYINALITMGAMGRYGVTPFWKERPSFSVTTFGSVGPNGAFDFNESLREQRLRGATNVSQRDFQLGKATLTCWQYFPAHSSRVGKLAPNDYWEIACSTPASLRDRDFYAYYYGGTDKVLPFYKVLEHVTPID